MIELIDLCIQTQKRVIEAHEKSLDAVRQTVKVQETMQNAAKANMAAWNNWLSLWGWRP